MLNENSSSLSNNDKEFVLQTSISAFRILTSSKEQFSLKNYKSMQTSMLKLWDDQPTLMEKLIRLNSDFVEDYYGTMGNLLSFIKQTSGTGESVDISIFNNQYSVACESLRDLNDLIEKRLSQNVYEGENYQKTFGDEISIQIQKFGESGNFTSDDAIFEDPLTGSQVNFPIHRAKRSSARNSVSVTTFAMNPFFGSRYQDPRRLYAIITPVTFSVNYRDADGTALETDMLKGLEADAELSTTAAVHMNFKSVDYNTRYFNKKISFCAAFDAQDGSFMPSPCKVTFDVKKGTADCKCTHLSYYTLVEDYDDRKPPVAPTFKDIPFVIASVYLVVFLLIGGLVFTINHDRT